MAAQIEDEDTLRVTGHDTGPRVREFFGPGISSYEWAYIVPAARVDTLLRLLGGAEGDDVLDPLTLAFHGGLVAVRRG